MSLPVPGYYTRSRVGFSSLIVSGLGSVTQIVLVAVVIILPPKRDLYLCQCCTTLPVQKFIPKFSVERFVILTRTFRLHKQGFYPMLANDFLQIVNLINGDYLSHCGINLHRYLPAEFDGTLDAVTYRVLRTRTMHDNMICCLLSIYHA
jgi:hypothetical protein